MTVARAPAIAVVGRAIYLVVMGELHAFPCRAVWILLTIYTHGEQRSERGRRRMRHN